MSILGNDDSIQRALNEQRKRRLAERYGAMFNDESSQLPPEVESDWLGYIEEFEQKFENSKITTVRTFVGNPQVRLLGEIPPNELSRELERLLVILDENNIIIEFPANISNAEKYRSITEELFNEETEDVRIEGMMHVFIYGESDLTEEEDDMPT